MKHLPAFLIVSQPLWIFMFFFLQNWSLLLSIPFSSSFSVIHVSGLLLLLLLLYFFLKVRAISIQIKTWVDWISLHWYACGADGRSVYGHVITKFSRMGSLPHFLTHHAPPELRYKCNLLQNLEFSAFFNISETTRTIFFKSLHIIIIMYIKMSETFIKIDSLQHLEISRQAYPTNRSKICLQHSLFWRYAIFSKLMRTIHTSMTSTF